MKAEDGDPEEEITVKRGTLNKLKSTAANYKPAAKKWFEHKKNSKDKDLAPGNGADPKPKEGEGAAGGEQKPKDGDFVTRADQRKRDEKTAIKIATTPADNDPEEVQAVKAEIDAHFDDIKAFYKPPAADATPDEIAEAIMDAHAAWARRNGGKTPSIVTKRVVSDLGANRGQGGNRRPTNTAGTGGKTLPWPKKSGMEGWYKDKK